VPVLAVLRDVLVDVMEGMEGILGNDPCCCCCCCFCFCCCSFGGQYRVTVFNEEDRGEGDAAAAVTLALALTLTLDELNEDGGDGEGMMREQTCRGVSALASMFKLTLALVFALN